MLVIFQRKVKNYRILTKNTKRYFTENRLFYKKKNKNRKRPWFWRTLLLQWTYLFYRRDQNNEGYLSKKNVYVRNHRTVLFLCVLLWRFWYLSGHTVSRFPWMVFKLCFLSLLIHTFLFIALNYLQYYYSFSYFMSKIVTQIVEKMRNSYLFWRLIVLGFSKMCLQCTLFLYCTIWSCDLKISQKKQKIHEKGTKTYAALLLSRNYIHNVF